mmetsp:Transcript_32628/g.56688  ORF Transcript_32628/g.56688 Transcript_32628/m.56688 type:complete len:99 (+) Transcript_32628:728-1024(+)|eukprot:CAMPEP_0204912548 /NCGR_PEP_ID=MMETSP1397-20131031/10675_1 /ASSEMBLY_ACC=CAM_ASM_000891 /TAXON_ID=49980 /ORGANISM="Climacostomum Climacostomum virens, Strain Stock W-24" /LENGTH=98 /DNA_ID=CAMNT_0052083525 /DNA_START=550 /DNA_END=846 /DNA_ORIENTATION=+
MASTNPYNCSASSRFLSEGLHAFLSRSPEIDYGQACGDNLYERYPSGSGSRESMQACNEGCTFTIAADSRAVRTRYREFRGNTSFDGLSTDISNLMKP